MLRGSRKKATSRTAGQIGSGIECGSRSRVASCGDSTPPARSRGTEEGTTSRVTGSSAVPARLASAHRAPDPAAGQPAVREQEQDQRQGEQQEGAVARADRVGEGRAGQGRAQRGGLGEPAGGERRRQPARARQREDPAHRPASTVRAAQHEQPGEQQHEAGDDVAGAAALGERSGRRRGGGPAGRGPPRRPRDRPARPARGRRRGAGSSSGAPAPAGRGPRRGARCPRPSLAHR